MKKTTYLFKLFLLLGVFFQVTFASAQGKKEPLPHVKLQRATAQLFDEECNYCNGEHETCEVNISVFPLVYSFQKFFKNTDIIGGTFQKKTINDIFSVKEDSLLVFHFGFDSAKRTALVFVEGAMHCKDLEDTIIVGNTCYRVNEKNLINAQPCGEQDDCSALHHTLNSSGFYISTIDNDYSDISLTDVPGTTYRGSFIRNFSNKNECYTAAFDRKTVFNILNSKGCVGFRYFLGLAPDNDQNYMHNRIRIFIVGVDGAGKNYIAFHGKISPSIFILSMG